MARTCTEAETERQHLTLRYTDRDDGLRPVPGCAGFWRSPDIWIDHGGTATVDALTADSAPDAVNIVTVRVTNMTSDTTYHGINVEAWICPFGMSAAGPNFQVPSASVLPRTGFHPGPLAPGKSVEITCEPPWEPDETDGLISLAANCWADDPADGYPLTSALDFCCDAHQACRNLAVMPLWWVDAGPGNVRPAGFAGQFLATNPDPHLARDFTFQIVPVDPQEFSSGDEEHLKSYLPSGFASRPELPWDTVKYDLRDGGNQGKQLVVSLDPAEQRQLGVLFGLAEHAQPAGGADQSPSFEPIAPIFLFDIIQRSADDEVIGGFRLLVPMIH